MNYKKITIKEDNLDKPILDRLLANRNIKNKEEIERFLNPTKEDFISPYAFVDMKKAKERIENAIENHEKILIWGDFDCDGVTSTTILYKALSELKANVIKFIPDRLLHGHGLNSKELIRLISKEKVKLVITVDCGISNVSEINLLKSLKIDTIITDHHTTDTDLPGAYAIINPQVNNAINNSLEINDIQSLTYNSGSIVAYKLAIVLLENNKNQNLKDELLVIASCGAIADVVPLLGENRAIVTIGLDLLNNKKTNKGIYNLLSKNIQNRNITSYDIGFILAPRINAVGRLANAELSFDFLNEENDDKLNIIIEKLDNYNAIRQAKCTETYEEIEQYLKNNKQEQKNPAIILLNKAWHIGVIGIVAAHFVEKYNKPCFLMTVDENNNARCSIRSNENINVYNVLKENQDLFTGFGGHKLAGGCSFNLNEVSFDKVKTALLKTIKETSLDNKIEDTIKSDIELQAKDINFELIENINKLEPFGQNNEAPICAMFNVLLKEFKTIGKENNHLRMTFSKNSQTFQAIKWKEDNIEIPLDSKCDIAFYPKINTFNDTTTIQLEIIDIYSECVENKNKKNDLKIFDHRKKIDILYEVSKYLEKKELNIGIWAKTNNIKEKLSNYPNIMNNIINSPETYNSIMFFDYPSNNEELREIILQINPKKIHFMNCAIDENIENYIKQLNGMIKYCSNKLEGNLDLTKISQALGVNINFIQICLEILENINSIEILDVDKIKYISAFSYDDFKNDSMFEILVDEFNKIISYKQMLKNCDIKELEEELSII